MLDVCMSLLSSQDAGAAAKATSSTKSDKTKTKTVCAIVDGKFSDYRWSNGRWNFAEFL